MNVINKIDELVKELSEDIKKAQSAIDQANREILLGQGALAGLDLLKQRLAEDKKDRPLHTEHAGKPGV